MCYKEMDGTCLKKKIEKQKQAGGIGLPKFLKQSPKKTLDTLRNLPTVSLISRKLGMDANPMNEWYIAKNMEHIFGKESNKTSINSKITIANAKAKANAEAGDASLTASDVKTEMQSLVRRSPPDNSMTSTRNLINGSLIVIIIGIILYCALLPGPCAVLFVGKKIYNSSKSKGKDGFLTKLKKFYYDVLMNQSFFPIGKLDENGYINLDSAKDNYRYFIKTTFSKDTFTRQTLVTIDEIIAVEKNHIPKMKRESKVIKDVFCRKII